MHTFEFILVMLGAVLVSNLISRLTPRVSTPLVQIAIGIALTILPISFEVELEPELFLVLFIAPLLFEDAKKADKAALWKLKRPILMLALVLVFLTTLVVGFAINLFTPSIPLAACFALAAALSPTDAVSVSALKESTTISRDQDHLLQGEALLNDASGIVSFQFAIAAALTGGFSLLDASIEFVWVFVGGLVVGVVLMLLRSKLVNFIRASRVDNTTFDVLFELITPFLVFLIAEFFHVSGVIAVVAAGITYSFSPRKTTPTSARHNVVATSAWSVLTFSLNGLVFLILGTQLPYVIRRVWSSSASADYLLIAFIAIILLAILLLRFIWVFIMHRDVDLEKGEVEQAADLETANEFLEVIDEQNSEFAAQNNDPTRLFGESEQGDEFFDEDKEFEIRAARRREARAKGDSLRKRVRAKRQQMRAAEKKAAHASPHYWKLHLHDALLLSLTGVKGAITLVVVMGIPLTLSDGLTPFPERDLILFLASGVIVLSLLTANFVVPLIAPKRAAPIHPQTEVNAILDIYRQVIGTLLAKVTPKNKVATEEVVQQYYARIENSKLGNLKVSQDDAKIRKMIIGWEQENTLKLVEEGKVSAITSLIYLDQLSRTLARLQHHHAIGWEIQAVGKQLAVGFKQFNKRRKQAKEIRSHGKVDRQKTALETRGLAIANYNYAVEKLRDYSLEPDAPSSLAKLIVLELERRVSRLQNPREMLRGNQPGHEDIFLEVETYAMEVERKSINMAADCNKISRTTAKELLDNVAIMELDIEEQLS